MHPTPLDGGEETWYDASSTDPIVISPAFAAAGVLTAGGWDPQLMGMEAALAETFRQAGTGPIAWEYPRRHSANRLPPMSDTRLAAEWEHLKTDGPVRLIVPVQGDFQHLTRICSLVTYSFYRGTPLAGGPAVTSVVFTYPGTATQHDWQWPLRFVMANDTSPELAAELKSVRAVRREFVSWATEPRNADALLFAKPERGPLEALKDLPAIGMTWLWNAPDPNLETLKGLTAPALFLQFTERQLAEMVNEFADQIAHNHPLDVAVFLASRKVVTPRPKRRFAQFAPPILIIPRAGFPRALGDVQLEHRVLDLMQRLNHLPGHWVIGSPSATIARTLGVDARARTVAEYLAQLTTARLQRSLVFNRETDAARALRSIEPVIADLEGQLHGLTPIDLKENFVARAAPERPPAMEASVKPSRTLPQVEAPRYTDVTLYADHLFPGDDLQTSRRIGDQDELIPGLPYTLAVAIRRVRSGIGYKSKAKRSVINPRESAEVLTVYVVANPSSPAIRVPEPVATLAWPLDSDTPAALFRLELSELPTAGAPDLFVELRLYHRNLDLLDIVQVFLSPVRRLQWPEDKVLGLPSRPDSAVRQLSIHLSPRDRLYDFAFTFLSAEDRPTTLTAQRRLAPADLQQLLFRIRDFWHELVITNYAKTLNVTTRTYQTYLARLRGYGEDAWYMLFGDRAGGQEGAGEAIGQLITSLEWTDGALIQVTFQDGDLGDFIFPWSLLYPPAENRDDRVDPGRFWGARFQIEQVRSGAREDGLGNGPVDVALVLDPSFGHSEQQRQMFDRYVDDCGGRLRVTEPISDARTLRKMLLQIPSSHIAYFFCHGYAPSSTPGIRRDGAEALKRRIEALPVDSPERRSWDVLLQLTARMQDKAWMFIGNAEIDEAQFRGLKFFSRRRPIVFMNMCQSADLLPSMNQGFVRIFLDHNAAAVIGTESPMTSVFAHEFSRHVFDRLLAGEDVGTALLATRQHFLAPEVRNPLGLAYTLYGRATARLGLPSTGLRNNTMGTQQTGQDESAVIAAAQRLALGNRDADSLAILLGKRDVAIKGNPTLENDPNFEPPYESNTMGGLDDLKALGWRIVRVWNQRLHEIVCGNAAPDLKNRESILKAVNLNEAAVVGAVASALLALRVPPALAAVIAPIVATQFIFPAKDELCAAWGEAIKAQS